MWFTLKSGTSDERGTGRQKYSCQKDQMKVALEMRTGKKQRKREAALGNLLFLYADSHLQSSSLPGSEFWPSKQSNQNLSETSDDLSCRLLVWNCHLKATDVDTQWVNKSHHLELQVVLTPGLWSLLKKSFINHSSTVTLSFVLQRDVWPSDEGLVPVSAAPNTSKSEFQK